MTKHTFMDLFNHENAVTKQKPNEQMMELLGNENPTDAIQALSEMEFYELVHGVGLFDASDLMAFASGEQIRASLDIDVWRRDKVHETALVSWVEAMLELSDEDFVRVYHETDPELLALYIKNNITIYASDDPDDEVVIPKEDEHLVRRSPDFTYWIAYPEDEKKAAPLQALVDRLYRTLGVERAWATLEEMQWELPTDLEEKAYYFRTARMESLGFPKFDDAAEIYSRYDLHARVEVLRKSSEKSLITGSLFAPSYFNNALVVVEEHDIADSFLKEVLIRFPYKESFKVQLLALTNAIVVYDNVNPSELEGYPDIMLEAMERINIGLEYLAEQDLERAVLYLEKIPVKHIFNVGFNVSVSLAENLQKILSQSRLSIIEDKPLSLLTDPERDVIEGLLLDRPRPAYSSAKGFTNLKSIEESARLVADIAFYDVLFRSFLNREYDDIARIAYGNELIHGVESVNFHALILGYLVRKLRGDSDLWAVFDESSLPTKAELLKATAWDNAKVLLQKVEEGSLVFAFKRLLFKLQHRIEEEYPESDIAPDLAFFTLLLCSE